VTPSRRAAACLVVVLLTGAAAGADEADRPEILHVAVPGGVVAGRAAQARLTYHAPRGNIVAVVQVVEDLEGARRVTTQREIGVIAAAFGREEGDLLVPLAFATAGRKRVVLTLLTDEREESEPASIEIEVLP
jgi:hypothetical protein